MQIVGKDKKTRKVIEVERKPNSKRHKERVKEYEKCGIKCETRPVKDKEGDN